MLSDMPTEWRRRNEARLRDVLEFLRTDPGQLTVAGRREWLTRLRRVEGVPPGADHAPIQGARVATSPQVDADDAGAVADLLRHVHDNVSQGLRGLLARPEQEPEPWELPAGDTELLAAVVQDRPVRRRFYAAAVSRSETDTIIMGIAGLVQAVGETLRECPRCTTIFLGRKKGLYCGRACQQAEMVARRAIRRREERRRPARRKKGA